MLKATILEIFKKSYSCLLILAIIVTMQGCGSHKNKSDIPTQKVAVLLPYKPSSPEAVHTSKLQKLIENSREMFASNLIFTFHDLSNENDIDRVIDTIASGNYRAVIGPRGGKLSVRFSDRLSKLGSDIVYMPLDISQNVEDSAYKGNVLRPVDYNSSQIDSLMRCLTNEGYTNIITLLPKTHESLNTREKINQATEKFGGEIIAEEFYLTTSNKYARHMEKAIETVADKVKEIMEDDTNWFKPVVFVNETENKQQFYKTMIENELFSNAKIVGLNQINPPYKQEYTSNSSEFNIYFPGSEKLVDSRAIKKLHYKVPEMSFSQEEMLILDYMILLNENYKGLSKGSKSFLASVNNRTFEGFSGKFTISSGEMRYSYLLIKREGDKLEKFCPYFN